jgi:RNA polymerase sigma factor (sigma-70 family)
MDVIGGAYPRLSRALDEVKPSSPAQFFGLARLQMHRALLDHVRKFDGTGQSPKPRTVPKPESDGSTDLTPGVSDTRQRDLLLDLLAAMDELPDNQATTTWLKLAGYTHREIAEVLGVHHDTVDTYWSKACVTLAKKLAPFIERK